MPLYFFLNLYDALLFLIMYVPDGRSSSCSGVPAEKLFTMRPLRSKMRFGLSSFDAETTDCTLTGVCS